jgi:alkanesulfonate monooxygenase SsuD/methylene tetrahydromethanopterin reductase-like flavin-dependent oxidoreductase (luciferase family)
LTLAHEQFPVPELVDLGVAAEQAGFDLLATSEHLHPWQANEDFYGSQVLPRVRRVLEEM